MISRLTHEGLEESEMRTRRGLALSLLLFALIWRCFESELFVPNTTARVSDVAANTEICRRENQRRDGQRNGCLRHSKLSYNPDSRQRSDNVKNVNQLLATTHVLVEPFISGFINHCFHAIVPGFPVV